MQPFNPFETAANEDPYAIYAKYREHDPVHRGMSPIPGFGPSWYLFSYADIYQVMKDSRLAHNREPYLHPEVRALMAQNPNPLSKVLQHWILLLDPPVHTRLRFLVNRSFTRKAVALLRVYVSELADELIDRVAEEGEFDLFTQYANHIPLNTMLNILGLPNDNEEMLRYWSKTVADAVDLRQEGAANVFDIAIRTTAELLLYLEDLFLHYDTLEPDGLFYQLAHECSQGDQLSKIELFGLTTMLLFAGQETTADALGNSFLSLLQHPDQLSILRQRPDIIPGAVIELLRFNSSVQYSVFRIITEDIKIGDKILHEGENVAAVFGSANRDPEKYERPSKLDVTRVEPGGNLIFGQGIHLCIGMHLARLEMEVALEKLFDRLPEIHLDSNQLNWRQNITFRGLTSLPVSL